MNPLFSLLAMKSLSLALLLLASPFLLTGCTETHADDHEGHDHTPAAATFKEGHGLQLTPTSAQFIDLKTAEFTGALPDSARLRTIKGNFVFVANGDWLLRTPVTLAPDGTVIEGLYEGDVIVTQGTQALWLAELQATNGGVGCADGH